ncbi:MAG: CHAT domain-containing protein [Paracoccaceae bacterium]
MMRGISSAIFRSASSRLLTAAIILGVASCGITKPSGDGSNTPNANLRETAEKASNLTTLERQAYTRNTLLKFSEAEQNYREVIRLANELLPRDQFNVEQESAEAMSLLLHLALNKSNLRQFDLAEEFFARSRTIVQEYGAVSEAAKPDLFYAQHWMNQKQYDRALNSAQDALVATEALLSELREDGSSASFDRIMLLRQDDGSLLLNQREADLANSQTVGDARFDGESKALTERQRLNLQRTHAHYIIARAKRAQNRPDAEIDADVDSANDLLSQIPIVYGRWLRAEIASLRADRFVREGNPRQAVAELSSAIELLRQYQTDTRPEAILWFRKGEYLIEAGNGTEARAAYSKALQILRESDQGLEFKQVESVISQLLTRVQTGDLEAQQELFTLMQKVRSSATAQTVAQLSARLASGDSEEARTLRLIQDLERQENVLRAQFDRLQADPNADFHRKRVLSSKLSEKSKELVDARNSLQNPEAYNQLVDETIDLQDAQKLLADGEVMAVIQLGENNGLVGVVTNTFFTAYEVDLSIEGAEEAVKQFRQAVDLDTIVRLDPAGNYELFETLFGPVKESVIDSDHLIVVPSGPLLSMPFNTLIVEEYTDDIPIVDQAYFDYSKVKWLGAETGVTTGVSISSFFLGRSVSKPSRAGKAFVGFGDFREFGENEDIISRIIDQRQIAPTCREDVGSIGTIGELEGTLDELKKVQAVLGIADEDVILGDDFTDTRVKETQLNDYRVLHFATHGVLGISEECLPEPGLITSIASDGDAMLEASEILELKLDADLVVMSACNTGQGAGAVTDQIGLLAADGLYAAGGEGLNGLARSFFFAGARNVLSTLWQADDISAQELMVLFYETASSDEPVSIAEAMRLSQAKLIEGGEFSHPYFWAPFATIGDGARKLRFDQPDS